jgi:nuclear RNA export factor
MVVHSYLGTGSFDSKSSLAVGDVAIAPPSAAAVIVPAMPSTGPVAAVGDAEAARRAALIDQCRQRTGMNAAFCEMCLAPNNWDLEAAIANFESIRSTIPPEAFV